MNGLAIGELARLAELAELAQLWPDSKRRPLAALRATLRCSSGLSLGVAVGRRRVVVVGGGHRVVVVRLVVVVEVVVGVRLVQVVELWLVVRVVGRVVGALGGQVLVVRVDWVVWGRVQAELGHLRQTVFGRGAEAELGRRAGRLASCGGRRLSPGGRRLLLRSLGRRLASGARLGGAQLAGNGGRPPGLLLAARLGGQQQPFGRAAGRGERRGVRLDVLAQVVGAHEGLEAELAGELLLARVDAHVPVQLVRAGELLRAEGELAHEGLLARVPPEVRLQVRRLAVLLAAARMVAHVHQFARRAQSRAEQQFVQRAATVDGRLLARLLLLLQLDGQTQFAAIGTVAAGPARVPPTRRRGGPPTRRLAARPLLLLRTRPTCLASCGPLLAAHLAARRLSTSTLRSTNGRLAARPPRHAPLVGRGPLVWGGRARRRDHRLAAGARRLLVVGRPLLARLGAACGVAARRRPSSSSSRRHRRRQRERLQPAHGARLHGVHRAGGRGLPTHRRVRATPLRRAGGRVRRPNERVPLVQVRALLEVRLLVLQVGCVSLLV